MTGSIKLKNEAPKGVRGPVKELSLHLKRNEYESIGCFVNSIDTLGIDAYYTECVVGPEFTDKRSYNLACRLARKLSDSWQSYLTSHEREYILSHVDHEYCNC